MSGLLQNIDRVGVVFDDESLVADAGLLAAATLMDRLGLEELVDRVVRIKGRVGGANAGRKTLTLVSAMLAGGSHIDHVNQLRAGSTGRVLGFRVMAPSTVGTFLRSFTWGHVRQLEKVLTLSLRRAWRLGAGPPKNGVTVDLDSTICEVSGKAKTGASYGYTKVLGYHPLLAFRADTGEVVGARLREGASQRGVVHFAKETIRRARRAGAKGPINVRADSGFWSYDMVAALNQLGLGWSVTVPLNAKVRAMIAAIDDEAWTAIDYPEGGEAQVAETELEMINSKKRTERRKVRLVVRRTRLTGPQPEFWDNWRHHAFVTNLDASPTDTYRHHTRETHTHTHENTHTEENTDTDTDTDTEENTDTDTDTDTDTIRRLVEVDRYHRSHAVCELAIRDLKGSAGLAHLPSGSFNANAAWLLCAALAHNLYRQIAILGQTQPTTQLVCGRTIRTRLFGLPGRLVNHSGHTILRLPARWPWATAYQTTLANLRGLPQLC